MEISILGLFWGVFFRSWEERFFFVVGLFRLSFAQFFEWIFVAGHGSWELVGFRIVSCFCCLLSNASLVNALSISTLPLSFF